MFDGIDMMDNDAIDDAIDQIDNIIDEVNS
jgi:hypothetical protein